MFASTPSTPLPHGNLGDASFITATKSFSRTGSTQYSSAPRRQYRSTPASPRLGVDLSITHSSTLTQSEFKTTCVRGRQPDTNTVRYVIGLGEMLSRKVRMRALHTMSASLAWHHEVAPKSCAKPGLGCFGRLEVLCEEEQRSSEKWKEFIQECA